MILLLLKFSNVLFNLNSVKIMAQLEIQGPAAKSKGAHGFLQGPRGFYRSYYLKINCNPWDRRYRIEMLGDHKPLPR